MAGTGSDACTVYLTSGDKTNFRFDLYPAYKANRTAPKPVWYRELRDYLSEEYQAEMVAGREADDAMADAQTDDTTICSIDKDLDQVPGKHYNFVTGMLYEIEPFYGMRWFYYQMLVGDRTDNVPGVRGIGPKKAERILGDAQTEEELFERVRRSYQEVYKDDGDKLMLLYGRLLKIGGDLWDGVPHGKKESTEVDSKLKPDPSSKDSDSSTNQ